SDGRGVGNNYTDSAPWLTGAALPENARPRAIQDHEIGCATYPGCRSAGKMEKCKCAAACAAGDGDFTVPLTPLDRDLLKRCLNHEPGSWNDFVDRFLGLIYHVIN